MESLDESAFKPVLEYVEQLRRNVASGQGLILSGPPGTGKTWALVALTKHAFDLYSKSHIRFDCEFVTAPNMFERMPMFESGDESSVDARRNRSWSQTYRTVPWLVINDLGKEYRGGQMKDQVVYKLGRILRERSERMVPTFISTNLALRGESTLKDVYGESIVSLLSETSKAFVINGQDRRKA